MITIFDTFTDAIDKLPRDIKARVLDTFKKYEKKPSLSGLNLEKIKARDQDVYSIRVNDDYRIICKVYNQSWLFALYVGKHDDAYDWANTHTATIDAVGVLSVNKAPKPIVSKEGNKKVSRLDVLTDQEMAELGIQPADRNALREQVFFPKHLLGYKQVFSEETYMVLEDILNGNDKDEALDFYRSMKSCNTGSVAHSTPLFDISSEDIALMGVPIDKIDLVSSISSIEEFRSIQSMLPANAIEAIYKYIDGVPVKEIIETNAKGNKPANEDDIETIINNLGTQQNAVTIDNEVDLERLFSMPMEKWRVYLHPEQRRIVESTFNGPARVIGGAGTGKTVVIVHRAKELAKKCKGEKCILVTTFSKTLAEDISSRLQLICTEEELNRIEVRTFDSVTAECLGYFFQLHVPPYWYLKYDQPDGKFFINDTPLKKAWRVAWNAAKYYDFDFDFYSSEWRDVFQGQKISTLDEYLNVKRKGKGNKKLNKEARERVFKVVTEYKKYMGKNKWIDIDWAQNYCAENLPKHIKMPLYKHILVDECQDFTSSAFRLLRTLAGPEHPNDLFLAGDSRQRIYNGHSSLSSCGIAVNNRSFQIRTNYRTTREIYELSQIIQQGYDYDNLDEHPIENDESVPTKHGELPIIKGFSDLGREGTAVINNVKKRISEGYNPSEICIVAKQRNLARNYSAALRKIGVDSLFLDNDQSDDKQIVGVRTATMHRVKGMEFDCMYIVSVNEDLLPNKREFENPNNDAAELKSILKREANLLSVAVTRARKMVWLSYWGTPSVLLKNVKRNGKAFPGT